MKNFYYVHNRKMGNPTHRHWDLKSAETEALRLSKKFKKNFYILHAVEKVNYFRGDNTQLETMPYYNEAIMKDLWDENEFLRNSLNDIKIAISQGNDKNKLKSINQVFERMK